MKMKKSCFLISYDRYMNEEKTIGVLDRVKADGFDAVEPYPAPDIFNDTDGMDNTKRVKEKIEKYGLECSCFSYGINILDDPKAAYINLKKAVDIAHVLGSPYLHHTMQLALEHKGLPVYQQVENTFVDVSRAVAEYAGEKGIICIYENQGFLINTVDRLGSLLSKIDMPNTGVCLDVGNSLFYDIEPEDYAGAFASLIKHVHVKDYLRKKTYPGKNWYRTISGDYLCDTPIGHGVVDFEKIITMLIKSGYNGYYSLEGGGNADDQQKGILRSMETLQFYYDRAVENAKR